MTDKKPQKTRRPVKHAIRLSGSCELFATFAMPCPLCRMHIPANTHHKCRRTA